jgi:hypothetical protein
LFFGKRVQARVFQKELSMRPSSFIQKSECFNMAFAKFKSERYCRGAQIELHGIKSRKKRMVRKQSEKIPIVPFEKPGTSEVTRTGDWLVFSLSSTWGNVPAAAVCDLTVVIFSR